MSRKIWRLNSILLCCLPLFAWGQQSNLPTSGQAQIFTQMQQMQNQINQLQGEVEELQLLIKRMQKESLDRYRDLDSRLGSGAAPAVNNSGAIDANAPLTPPPAANQGTSAADPAQEKVYYDAAFGLIQKRDYPKAIQAFTAFLNKFPNSQYAGNAQYWLAEVNLAQGDIKAASAEFSKVLRLYPDHQKVPDAMYKLADVELKLGNNAKAKELFNQVTKKYPNSSAAALAKRSLQTLN